MASKVAFAFLSFFIFSTAHAAENSIGIFMTVKGDVRVARGAEKSAAKTGQSVFEGDVITASADSRAKIAMKDRNIISVSPNTVFKIQGYKADASARNVELRLKTGKIRSEVNVPYDGEKNKFEIKTSSAVIGVRGTDFISSHNMKTNVTEVVTLHGKVWLSSVGKGAAPTVLSMGQMSSVMKNSTPSSPQEIKVEQLNEIKKDFDSSSKSPEAGDTSIVPQDGAATGESDSAKAGKDAKQESRKDRLSDKEDQSPDTFKELPDAPGGKGSLTQPMIRPPKPTSSNPSTDAIQNNQQQKTKVIIQPRPQ